MLFYVLHGYKYVYVSKLFRDASSLISQKAEDNGSKTASEIDYESHQVNHSPVCVPS